MKTSTFLVVVCSFLPRMKNISEKSCREWKHVLYSITFFFPEKRVVCEIMWKNIVERDRPQMTMVQAHCILYTYVYKYTQVL